MGNPYFRFKQFVVYHDRCAMKVGTDGVLLGAWCDVAKCASILDIGTGSGLIALMIAQRTADTAHIDGIEIDENAAMQAIENVARSPWHSRISIIHDDFLDYASNTRHRYDRIISNPPYFENSLLSEEPARMKARHTDRLTYTTLLSAAVSLLTADGTISLIFPADIYEYVSKIANLCGLYAYRIMWVSGRVGILPKRIMVEWGRCNVESPLVENMAIETAPLQLTPEYVALTRDFYLKL